MNRNHQSTQLGSDSHHFLSEGSWRLWVWFSAAAAAAAAAKWAKSFPPWGPQAAQPSFSTFSHLPAPNTC